jgi:hypothetical protein
MATQHDNEDLSSLTDRQLLTAIYSELRSGLRQVSAGLAGVELAVRDLTRAHAATAGRTDALIVDVRALMADNSQIKGELKLAHARVLDLERHVPAVAAGKRTRASR